MNTINCPNCNFPADVGFAQTSKICLCCDTSWSVSPLAADANVESVVAQQEAMDLAVYLERPIRDEESATSSSTSPQP